MELKPCKHLDYEDGKYCPDIELKDCAPHYPMVRYWHRGERWTNNGPGEKPNPAKVQFCKQRGRINGIFGCYTGETGHCYEPETPNVFYPDPASSAANGRAPNEKTPP